MLDFASKYVVQNCDAPVGVGTGLMAVGVLAPLWLWALASAAHFAQGSQRTRVLYRVVIGHTAVLGFAASVQTCTARPRVWPIRLLPVLTGGYCGVHNVRPRLEQLEYQGHCPNH